MIGAKKIMCCVVFIKNTLNFDAGFPFDPKIEECMGGSGKTIKYIRYDNETLEKSSEKQFKSYRMRLSGITDVNKNFKSRIWDKRVKESKYEFISWNRRTGGIYICEYVGMDRYNRLLINLIDPITGVNVADHMIEKFGGCYERHIIFYKTMSEKSNDEC